jgi:hypothetical protein
MTDAKSYPNKSLQPWIPKSMRDSGAELETGCEITTADAVNAAAGMDKAFAPLTADKGKP